MKVRWFLKLFRFHKVYGPKNSRKCSNFTLRFRKNFSLKFSFILHVIMKKLYKIFIVRKLLYAFDNGALFKMFPYSKSFWSIFSRVRTEYGFRLRKSSYSVQMPENANQENSKHGHFSSSGGLITPLTMQNYTQEPHKHLRWRALQQ